MAKKVLAGIAAVCCLLAVALPVGAQTVTANITGTGKCYSSRTSSTATSASGKLETYYNTGTVKGEGAYQNGTYYVAISLQCGGGDVREGSGRADGTSRYWRAGARWIDLRPPGNRCHACDHLGFFRIREKKGESVCFPFSSLSDRRGVQ